MALGGERRLGTDLRLNCSGSDFAAFQ